MFMNRHLIALFIILGLVWPECVVATSWTIDPARSNIGFTISKLLITGVTGNFPRYTASIDLDEVDLTRSQVAVTIDPASINTDNAKRDDHLRSPDYFDVARYPYMTFESKQVVNSGNGRYQLIGDLTIRGVSREVILDVEKFSLPVKDSAGHQSISAAATARVNRKDFGLAWDSVLEKIMALGNEVTIIIDVTMIPAQSESPTSSAR
jgi:polyisoprenoid-binding protein YceI